MCSEGLSLLSTPPTPPTPLTPTPLPPPTPPIPPCPSPTAPPSTGRPSRASPSLLARCAGSPLLSAKAPNADVVPLAPACAPTTHTLPSSCSHTGLPAPCPAPPAGAPPRAVPAAPNPAATAASRSGTPALLDTKPSRRPDPDPYWPPRCSAVPLPPSALASLSLFSTLQAAVSWPPIPCTLQLSLPAGVGQPLGNSCDML